MRRTLILAALTAVTACHNNQPQQQQPTIRVRSDEQKQLHQLDAFNLAIGLKHAIYDAGFNCDRITDAGFVGTYKNLEMWTAHCVSAKAAARDWAVFPGAHGSGPERGRKDIGGTSLPA